MKLIHKKMPVSVRFRLNPQGGKERLLQYILNVDDTESTKFGVRLSDKDKRYVKLRDDEWVQGGQFIKGNTPDIRLANKTIAQIKHTLMDIHEQQFDDYWPKQELFEKREIPFNPVPRPTWQSVHFEYKHKKRPWVIPIEPIKGVVTGAQWSFEPPTHNGPMLFDGDMDIKAAMTAFLLEMRVMGKRTTSGKIEVPSKVILALFDRTAILLNQYQGVYLPVRLISAQWADSFHYWMQTQPEGTQRITTGLISQGNATRHIRRVREMVNWLHRSKGALQVNPLAGLTWRGHEKKEVESLTREQLTNLENLACQGTTATARAWFLIMAYSGLDYPDAKLYVTSPNDFEVMTEAGMTIQGSRLKTGVAYCIPRVSQLDALFARYPAGPRPLSPQKLNNYIRDILAPAIGFEGHLTIKIARKTAGTFFLDETYNIAEVSRALGHSTVAVTEAHYLKVTNQTVIRGMVRVARDKDK